jgi:hypothetical protein
VGVGRADTQRVRPGAVFLAVHGQEEFQQGVFQRAMAEGIGMSATEKAAALRAELALTRNALSNLYWAVMKETHSGVEHDHSVSVEFALSEAKKVLGE